MNAKAANGPVTTATGGIETTKSMRNARFFTAARGTLGALARLRPSYLIVMYDSTRG